MTEKTNEELNRQWFAFYVDELENRPENYKKFDKYFLCPCCYFPTLTERHGFEICSLCNWEDDGQDDHNADKVLGGPNKSYSLTEARQNFKSYLTSYRPSDTYHFERTTLKIISNKNGTFKLFELKKLIIDEYNLAIKSSNSKERTKYLKEANKLEKLL